MTKKTEIISEYVEYLELRGWVYIQELGKWLDSKNKGTYPTTIAATLQLIRDQLEK